MLGYERAAAESPDRESASRADEYTRNFLQDEALPTIWQELALHRRFVPAITARRTEQAHRRLVPRSEPPGGRVGAGSGRDRAARPQPQLEAVVKSAAAKKVEAYTDAAAGQKLMEAPPAARQDREDDRARPRRASPSGRCRTVRRSSSSRRSSKRIRSCSARPRPAAPRSRVTPTSSSARVADAVVSAGGVGAVQRRRPRSDAERQGGRRPPVHRRRGPGDGRREHAAGSGDDVPAPLPALHAATRRSDRVRGDGLAGPRAAGEPDGQPRGGVPPDARHGADPEQPAPPAADAGDRRSVEPRQVDGVLQGPLRRCQQLHVRVRRQLHAGVDQAADRDLRREPAGDARARRPGATKGSRRRPASSRRPSSRASRRRARWRSSSRGPFEYDEPHRVAFRAMSLVLQSRLLDAIREELGGTYSITATPDATKYPQPGLHRAHRMDVRPGAHRAAGPARVQRDRRDQEHAADAQPDGDHPRRAEPRVRERTARTTRSS